jgi:D-alanyl-D-alanine carboxypeptidase (penicillin-binding protein 5/6)
MPGVDGLKTGYYRKAGYNIAATAKKDGLRLIVVVMGSPTHRIRDTLAVEKFKTFFAAYEMIEVVRRGDEIDREIRLPNGKIPRIKSVAGRSFSCPARRDKKGAITKEINLPDEIGGEVKQGQVVGEMVIRSDNEEIGKVNLVSPVDVPRAGSVKKIMRFLGSDS